VIGVRELREVEVVAEGLAFPEGPVALADGSVIVVELMRGRVSRVGTDGAVSTVADVGGGPNGAAIGPDGALYVCNNGGIEPSTRTTGRIERVDLSSGRIDTLYTTCGDRELGSPNELVFDRTGNFYFTDHLHDGAIYYAAADGSTIRRVLSGLASPNGIGISPDGGVLYWAETHLRQVLRRRILSPGELEPSPGFNVRALVFGGTIDRFALVAGLPGNHELDSLAVDASGAVCVGTLVEAGISEITTDGSWTLHTLPASLADPIVTNICFGGDDLRTAFITCSATGRLIRCRWHRPGLPLAFNI
jgi:gluconolactonase